METLIKALAELTVALVVFQANAQVPTVQNIQTNEVEEVKEAIDPRIEKLIYCESRGNEKAIGDNGLAQGILQFHKPTFIRFAKKYGVFSATSTDDEVLTLYKDSKTQIKVATAMIENEKNGLNHWSNCKRIMNLE